MEAFDGLQAWLETEAQLGRVLQALASTLDRLPALERAAAGAATASGEAAEAPYMAASYVKELTEAERLAGYLTPLMNQLAKAAAQVERAVGGLEEGRNASSSQEVALACRSLLGMLSPELMRKQALAGRITATLGPLFLYLPSGFEATATEPTAAATVRDAVRAWPLGGGDSFVDLALVRDVVAAPSLGLGPPRRLQLLQAISQCI